MRPRAAPELLIDPVEIRAHGMARELKLGADLLVRQALCDEAEDLLLTR